MSTAPSGSDCLAIADAQATAVQILDQMHDLQVYLQDLQALQLPIRLAVHAADALEQSKRMSAAVAVLAGQTE